jgi:anti-sigma factor RsiW
MKCGQARRLFGAYWDDELTQAEREWLEAHFGACGTCRGQYEELARALEMVGDLPRIEVAPNLAERALSRARRAVPVPDHVPSRTPRWIPVTAAVALLATAGATALQWSGMTPPRPMVGNQAPVLQDPTLVPQAVAGRPGPSSLRPGQTAGGESAPIAMTGLEDSLLAQGEDVEFILDAMTIRKGRAHPASRLAPATVRSEPAVITF